MLAHRKIEDRNDRFSFRGNWNEWSLLCSMSPCRVVDISQKTKHVAWKHENAHDVSAVRRIHNRRIWILRYPFIFGKDWIQSAYLLTDDSWFLYDLHMPSNRFILCGFHSNVLQWKSAKGFFAKAKKFTLNESFDQKHNGAILVQR